MEREREITQIPNSSSIEMSATYINRFIYKCIKEYGMKINGKKSKVVCINGDRKRGV